MSGRHTDANAEPASVFILPAVRVQRAPEEDMPWSNGITPAESPKPRLPVPTNDLSLDHRSSGIGEGRIFAAKPVNCPVPAKPLSQTAAARDLLPELEKYAIELANVRELVSRRSDGQSDAIPILRRATNLTHEWVAEVRKARTVRVFVTLPLYLCYALSNAETLVILRWGEQCAEAGVIHALKKRAEEWVKKLDEAN